MKFQIPKNLNVNNNNDDWDSLACFGIRKKDELRNHFLFCFNLFHSQNHTMNANKDKLIAKKKILNLTIKLNRLN